MAADAAVPVTFGVSASRLLDVSAGSGHVTVRPVGLKVGAPRVSGSTVSYQGVARDTDLSYVSGPAGVKEQLLLRSAGAPRSFRFFIDDPKGVLGKATGGGGWFGVVLRDGWGWAADGFGRASRVGAVGVGVGRCACSGGGGALSDPVDPLGASRVSQVVSHFGDDVIDTGRAVTTPYGSTDIDVVLRNNTFIEVGGPAKAANLAKFGQQLQRVQWAAQQAGGRAMFMYAPDTPQAAIDLANKWFGAGGAQPIP